MLSRLIGMFSTLNRRLGEAARSEDETAIDELDRKIVRVEREVFAYRARDRRDMDRQIEFFAQMVHRHSDDPDNVERYTGMLVSLFKRYLDRDRPLPARLALKVPNGYDMSLQELVLDSLPERVAVIGLDYRYIYTNERNASFHNLRPDAFIGRHLVEMIGKERFENRARPHLDRCFSGVPLSYDYEVVDPEGARHDVHCRMVPLRGGHGEIEGAVLLLTSQAILARAR